MSIFNEVQQLEHLTVIGKSLIKYAMSIEPGIVFERKADWWTPDEDQYHDQSVWNAAGAIQAG